ncbi:hypothetical protein HPP92_025414 [Vanilla planifolia]|uniref:Pectinesterase inhibitor domain-containing protein n=1 Tax=Vanilla planifolia TaxID=51239 RepID=A0A835PKK5_VANPL|nr:hypothetical protein HPP92_025414 [Vanilla planifolia]
MKLPSRLCLSGLFLLLLAVPSPAAETLNTMCNFLGGDYITYDYCVSTLGANPESRTADGHRLAVIAVNLTVTNATAIRSRAEALSRTTADLIVSSSLRNCSSLYGAAVPELLRSANATAAHNYTASSSVLAGVLWVPTGCDEAFRTGGGGGVASPIRKENDAFSDLTTLAKAVNNYMAQ